MLQRPDRHLRAVGAANAVADFQESGLFAGHCFVPIIRLASCRCGLNNSDGRRPILCDIFSG
jgi:hypothetical protein